MNVEKDHILIVEDNSDIAELLEYTLTKDGFDTRTVVDGEEALKAVKQNPPSLMLLDLMLPKLGGLDVARAVRTRPESSKLPIVMLTAKGDEKDIVAGLEMGADDYIVKPVKPKELTARIKAVLRRAVPSEIDSTEKMIKAGDLVVDEDRHEIRLAGKNVDLTLTEFQILTQLLKSSGRIFTRDQLIDKVRGHNIAIIDRNIDVHISSLRKKLKDYGKKILTVRGVGYRFSDS